jgi:hypothetical protein
MSDLRNLQRRFQNYLIGISDEIETDIISTPGALAEHRLGAYYNAYRIRLIDALAVDFLAVHKYLGEQAFENLALEYLQAHPSTQPSVRWFGKDLATYIDSNYAHEESEFLSELANFEWNKGLIFDAVDETSLFSLDDMALVPPTAWPDIRITFKPAIRYLDLYWNVCPCYMALEKGNPLPEKMRNEYPQRWLVWRKNKDPHWRSLDVHEAWVLESAQKGENFAAICEGLLEWVTEDQVAITAAGFLKQWISDELVTTIEY